MKPCWGWRLPLEAGTDAQIRCITFHLAGPSHGGSGPEGQSRTSLPEGGNRDGSPDEAAWRNASQPHGSMGCSQHPQHSPSSRVRSIASGSSYSLALLTDGTALAWDANEQGPLGDGTITLRAAPVRVPGLTGVTALAAGSGQSLVLRKDGTLQAEPGPAAPPGGWGIALMHSLLHAMPRFASMLFSSRELEAADEPLHAPPPEGAASSAAVHRLHRFNCPPYRCPGKHTPGARFVLGLVGHLRCHAHGVMRRQSVLPHRRQLRPLGDGHGRRLLLRDVPGRVPGCVLEDHLLPHGRRL
jgi:hypothetical protein